MLKYCFILLSVILTISSINAEVIKDRFLPQEAKNAMVVTGNKIATNAALKVLKDGGNAIDAAVTASFVLAVVQPDSGNIGGGGFMLISNDLKNLMTTIDYRETAPSHAYSSMFLKDNGEVDTHLSRYSHKSVGVPGVVAGMDLALRKYGTMSLFEVLQPAIKLARDGFKINLRLYKELEDEKTRLTKFNSTKSIFYDNNGSNYKVGDTLKQPQLAQVLTRLANNGAVEFYKGRTADLIVEEMNSHGGLITKEDLANYKAIERAPIHGVYRGYDIYSMSAPSIGGIHLIETLNMLENYNIAKMGSNSAEDIHILAESMQRAYNDGTEFLGDPDFNNISIINKLTSKKYAKKKIDDIGVNASASRAFSKIETPKVQNGRTNNFVVVDKYGNAVSNTYTLNFPFGSGIAVSNAGFLLNNEMDDFTLKDGTKDKYGITGGKSNKIEPNKRMLSSMNPTIIKKDGKNFHANK